VSYRICARLDNRRGFLVLLAAFMLGMQGCGSGDGAGDAPAAITLTSDSSPIQSFGLHVHSPLRNWPSVPFRYWRVWDSGVDWSRIETARGQFNFSLLDQYVSLAGQHNVRLIYVLGNTPRWASQDPSHIGTQGVAGATAPPADIAIWQEFVSAVAGRYKGRIYAYEVWNEANLDGYWTGSQDDMVAMVRVAHDTIKRIDPAAFVLAPSIVGGGGMDYLSEFLSKAAGSLDAVPFHLYYTNKMPEKAVKFYRQALSIAAQAGKDIWDTEDGWGPWGSFDNEQDAAAYLARNLILQSAAGVKVIVWFAWDDRGPWVHLYLVESDFQTPAPAAQAFEQVQSWLAGKTLTCSSDSTGTWQCAVSTATGAHTYIVWNSQGSATFQVPAEWKARSLTRLDGSQTSVGASVSISTSPVLLGP